jgi:hypothetical protein
VNVCCDGSSYQGCSRDTSKCSYTLTEEPEKASLTAFQAPVNFSLK